MSRPPGARTRPADVRIPEQEEDLRNRVRAAREAAMRERVAKPKQGLPNFIEHRERYYADIKKSRARARESQRRFATRKREKQRLAGMSIQRKPVRSSNIKAVGHDPKTNTLDVEFHSGAVHRYHGVTVDQHKEFMGAPSLGSYFHEHIKPLGGDRVA